VSFLPRSGSKWYEVMPPGSVPDDLEEQIRSGTVKGSWPDARDHWGIYHNKLEVVFVVRIPERLDRARIVPGRDNVFIAPITDCVPGEGKDTASYYSNQWIEACFVLKSPDSQEDRDKLDKLSKEKHKELPIVQCLSDRDEHHGMTQVTLRSEPVGFDERLPDELESRGNWCEATLAFTAKVAKPILNAATGDADAVLELHKWLHRQRTDKKLWAEDIARFKRDEMDAAIEAIDQGMPRAYTLAFYYTSTKEAEIMCTDGKGVTTRNEKEGVTVSLLSPCDLGWEQYGGGQWKNKASAALWDQTQTWGDEQLQAVLVMGVPTKYILSDSSEGSNTSAQEQGLSNPLFPADFEGGGGDNAHDKVGSFTIPPPLMVTADSDGNVAKPYYANCHIHKFYVLEKPEPELNPGQDALRATLRAKMSTRTSSTAEPEPEPVEPEDVLSVGHVTAL
jgi:hypothetical protein